MGALLLCITAAALISLPDVEAASASSADFQMNGDTLVKYTGTAGAVSIPTSVKHIGREAFAGHTELVKVEIPGYVEDIGYNAFSGCTSLETAVIPDTVTDIGNGAFSGCSSLKSVTFGKKVKKLGNGIFAGCNSLSSIKLSNYNENFVYEDGIIYSKDKTIIYQMLPGYGGSEYRMPATVKEIKSNAFWGCQNLKRVYFGSNVKSVPDYGFTNCTSLEKVSFPYSLRSIGIQAFAGCINLGETEIPMSVSSIHSTAFDGCRNLTIIAEAGSTAAKYEAARDKSAAASTEYQDIIPRINETEEEGGTENGEAAEEAGAAASGESLLGQSTIVAGNAVIFMDNSQSKVLSGNERPDTGTPADIGSASSAEVMGTGNGGAFIKYTIVNNEKIASQAYYKNEGLKDYQIPEGIKEIGEFSFARSGLTSISIPEGVTSIGYGAFYHCDDLSEINIPSSVTEIEPSAFAQTKWMEERKSDRTSPYTVVGDGILVAYGGMGSQIRIPDGVKQIGPEVFKENTRITNVYLPESVTVIGEEAFAGCSSLVGISGGDSVTDIKDRAFEGCPISTIKIPASVERLGLRAYDISKSGKPEGTKNAVFLGQKLPKVSYEKTATRLVNENYRDAVLKDVGIAVVDGSITAEDIKGTVLDYDAGGYRGLVCSVEKPASGEEPGMLKIKFCILRPEDVNSRTLPQQVTVYGKIYELSGQEEMEYLLGTGNEKTGEGEESTVTVEVSSITLPGQQAASAEISGIQGNYILRISDNSAAGSTISDAYRKAVSGGRIRSLQAYDISLYDTEKRIPITKLGRQQMTITLPKPNGILEENLQVVCLDEDGQLEKMDSHIVKVGGETCVQFQANRFSVYGIGN
ncbi:MAG TPA: hypothetical protein DCZ40_02545 [Lachnospiraceae bacterium]|nr:hypothetical protein [Lachnospiraceae bacterium]